jgi:CspA family cold shock protein
MPQGTIKKLVSERGFGFIAASGQELFFHHSSVEGSFESLSEGQTVEFEVDSAPNSKGKGPRAIQVRKV